MEKIPEDYFDSTGTLKLLWEEEWRGLGITQVSLYHGITPCGTNQHLVEPWMGALRGSQT